VSNLSEPSCFLSEWYRPEVTSQTIENIAAILNTAAATVRAEGSQVRLLITLAVPKDEVLYGLFSACSAATVALTCEYAGIPVERLSSDVMLGWTDPRGSWHATTHNSNQ
jgi:hypothetical protein